jgi:5'-3' exonuclease
MSRKRCYSTDVPPTAIDQQDLTKKKVLLIDGAPLIHRAYHGTPLKMTS